MASLYCDVQKPAVIAVLCVSSIAYGELSAYIQVRQADLDLILLFGRCSFHCRTHDFILEPAGARQASASIMVAEFILYFCSLHSGIREHALYYYGLRRRGRKKTRAVRHIVRGGSSSRHLIWWGVSGMYFPLSSLIVNLVLTGTVKAYAMLYCMGL